MEDGIELRLFLKLYIVITGKQGRRRVTPSSQRWIHGTDEFVLLANPNTRA
jgi:hypothetical protein